jgi:hypothetical protein
MERTLDVPLLEGLSKSTQPFDESALQISRREIIRLIQPFHSARVPAGVRCWLKAEKR